MLIVWFYVDSSSRNLPEGAEKFHESLSLRADVWTHNFLSKMECLPSCHNIHTLMTLSVPFYYAVLDRGYNIWWSAIILTLIKTHGRYLTTRVTAALRQQAAQRSPLCQFSVRRGPHYLVQIIAFISRVLLTAFKEIAVSVSIGYAIMRQI